METVNCNNWHCKCGVWSSGKAYTKYYQGYNSKLHALVAEVRRKELSKNFSLQHYIGLVIFNLRV